MKIEHIAMYAKNLEAAREFFTAFLNGHSNDGYHNQNTDFRSCFISFDDGARLELMTRAGGSDKAPEPYGLCAYRILCGQHSKGRIGSEVVSGPRTTSDGYYESCVVVLEGNQIEITV